MGQYYRAFFSGAEEEKEGWDKLYQPGYRDKKGNEVTFGSKITEHSWIGNTFVESISAKLYKEEARIMWIGDYSAGHITSRDGKFTASLENIYNDINPSLVEETEFDISHKFIVNLSRKEYVDVKKYIERSTVKSGPMKDWCLHPLPLLTSVGGDQGGGDYHSNNIDFDKVGRWAYDRIMIVDNKPEGDAFLGYKELEVTFIEK